MTTETSDVPGIPDKPRRWDPLVKLTHWGIVAAVIGNALITEEGSGWHIWVGYGLAGLLGLRLLWGLIGPHEARFTAFPPSPARAIAHLGEIGRGEVTRHASHNPLGALMVYAIWGTLLMVTGSGIAMSGPPPANPSAVDGHKAGEQREEGEGVGENRQQADRDESSEHENAEAREHKARPVFSPKDGRLQPQASRAVLGGEREERDEDEPRGKAVAQPQALASGGVSAVRAFNSREIIREDAGEEASGGENGEEDETMEEVHEIAVNLLYLLIALHLIGVVFETRRSGREIIGAMVPGGSRPA